MGLKYKILEITLREKGNIFLSHCIFEWGTGGDTTEAASVLKHNILMVGVLLKQTL